jgi:hypothetical protein
VSENANRYHVRQIIFAATAAAIVLSVSAAAFAQRTTPVPISGDVLRLSAAHPIPTEAAGQPGPIRIDACFSDGRGTDGLTLVHHALRVSNTGERAVTAVRIRFTFYDAFGDIEATRTNIAAARIDPGRAADRINVAELSDAGPPARITCSIDAVRYEDGSIARTGPPR